MRRITTSAGKHIDYAYNAKGETTSVSDGVSGNTEAYEYDNDYDRVKKYTHNAGKTSEYTESYAYDGYGQVSGVTQSGAAERTYTYAYKETAAHELASITTGMYKFSPQTDKLGRNAGREVWNNEAKLAAEYIYYRKVGDHATNMPSAVYFGKKSGENFPITESVKYAYDRMGNISRIDDNGAPVVWYKYDALNRLIREDNKTFGKTWLYSYDNNGNILCKRETAFTLKENVEESEFESVQYEYEGDKLLAYGTEACEYDAIGNPKTYRGKSVSWSNGRQMVNYNTTAFTYDGLGRRLSKGNVNYTYDGNNRIIKQSNGIEFIYDNSGVAGIVYNGTTYVYRKDGQGNICALIDSNGNVVVQYKYDAWGNHAVLDANEADINDAAHIGNLNPFRYRGYYYDTETGLYYLKSRYYDPETGRFITVDDISYIAPETINGLNLYAYCGNNPVMRIDSKGNDWNSFWSGVGNWFVGVGNSIGNFFTRDIPNWWNNDVVPFFTRDIPNFFTKTIPDWWNGSVVPWWNNDVVPFFTQDIPNFFTKTIPDFFVNTFWNDWIVDKLWNQFIVGIIWQQGLLPAWNWLKDNWKTLLDGISAVTSIGGGIVGLLGTLGVFSIPVVGQVILAIVSTGFGIYGLGRACKWW